MKSTRPTRPTHTLPTPSPVVATVEAAEAVRNVVPPARDARLPKEAPNIESAVNLSQPDVQPVKIQGSSKCAIPATQEKKLGYAENTEITENQELTHNTGVQIAPKSAEYDCLAKRIDKKIDEALGKKIDKKIDEALGKKIDKKIDKALGKKIDKKIDKALDFKCIWKKTKKSFRKKATKTLRKRMGCVVASILLAFSSSLSGDSKSFDSPKNRQMYAISATQYCPALESASPVAVTSKTPQQSVLQADNQPIQVY